MNRMVDPPGDGVQGQVALRRCAVGPWHPPGGGDTLSTMSLSLGDRVTDVTGPTNDAVVALPERRRVGQRIWNVLVATWAAVTGIAPHVLHHVGPLAGTALVAGAGGQLLFGAVGLVATIPMLVKLRRRFGSWVAPAIAMGVFAAVFSFSTFVIGPRISGAAEPTDPTSPASATELDAHGHDTTQPGDEGR